MADLRQAVDQLNSGKDVSDKLNGVATIYKLCSPDIYPESPPHEPARKVLLELLAEDLRTLDSLCELVEDVQKKNLEDPCHIAHCTIACIFHLSCNMPNAKFCGCLIENGFVHTLLDILPELKEEEPTFWGFVILIEFVRCDFTSTRYRERGLHVKGVLFSRITVLIDITEKAGCIRLYVRRVIKIFITYLTLEDLNYYKSTVKVFLKDGTINKVAKMFSGIVRDSEFIETYLTGMIESFARIRLCVADTTEEYKLHQNEIKLINRLAIRYFSTVCKDDAGQALSDTAMFIGKVVQFRIREEIQFYIDSKVFRMMASKFVQYFNSKDEIDYNYTLNNMIKCLSVMMNNYLSTSDRITLSDVRPLLPHIVDLVDPKKHSAAPPSFFLDRIRLAFQIMANESLLKEKHFIQLKDANILPLIVETIQRFEATNCSIMQWSLSTLMCCVGPEYILPSSLTLIDIDQVLPVIPILIKVLTGKSTLPGPPPESKRDLRPHAASYICSQVVKNLLRVKENKTGSITSQLNMLRRFNFVHGICEAVTSLHTENSPIIFMLTETLDKLSRLFEGREFAGDLIDFLPKLAEKHNYLAAKLAGLGPDSFHTKAQDSKAFFTESTSMMRKGAVYALDKLNPKFVVKELGDFVMSHWVSFRISGGKMFFSSDHEKTEEAFEEKGIFEEIFIDALRATWWMNRMYPELVSFKMKEYCPLYFGKLHDEPKDIKELVSARIVKTIISYLDHSQDKTSEFLTVLTTLVKDMADDLDDGNKLLFQQLLLACKRFMKVNSNKTSRHNLQHFIEVNRGATTC